MEEYRWGIFLAEQNPDRTVELRQAQGRAGLAGGAGRAPRRPDAADRRSRATPSRRRVEQQRVLGNTAPSIYDLRNLFQVNVEEGRHLWAMVYLLHAYFGREGREEAEQLLKRNSGDLDAPRILGAFNEETTDWLQFFMFTYFTDRDGKYQLGTLKESAFDPLARTCEFMLKEEAHHMFVGTTGVQRIVERTAAADEGARHRRRDLSSTAAIPLDGDPEVPQLPVLGLHGPVRLRAVHQRRQLLLLRAQGPLAGDPPQGRPRAARGHPHDALRRGRRDPARRTVPMLSALNLDLRDEYVADCANGVRRWNQALEDAGLERAAAPAARGVQPPGRRLRRAPRQPRGRGARRRRVGGPRRRLAADRPRTARRSPT